MGTRRRIATVAIIALATIAFGACVAINEGVTDRDLTCEETTDELCLRIADLALSTADAGPALLIKASKTSAFHVQPTDCSKRGHGPTPELMLPDGRRQPRRPDATRCWLIEGTDPAADYGAMWLVYEGMDGTLRVD